MNAENTTVMNITESISNHSSALAIIMRIRFWWITLLAPVGTVGNALSLMIMLRRLNRHISCCVYMAALAVCDTSVVMCNGINIWLYTSAWFHQLPKATLHSLCKSSMYCTLVSAQSGVMIILALMVERVVAITRPFDARIWFRPSRAVALCLALIVFTLLYNIPVIYEAGSSQDGLSCKPTIFYSKYSFAYSIINLAVNAVLPFVGIVVMNTVIMLGVKSSTKSVMSKYEHSSHSTDLSVISASGRNPDLAGNVTENRPAASSDIPNSEIALPKPAKMSSREKQLTIMTVTMTMVFVLCTMPRYATYAAQLMYMANPSDGNVLRLAGLVSHTLYVTNSACNFFLYIISGSKFRADLKDMFTCN